jgi:hypothetical protein
MLVSRFCVPRVPTRTQRAQRAYVFMQATSLVNVHVQSRPAHAQTCPSQALPVHDQYVGTPTAQPRSERTSIAAQSGAASFVASTVRGCAS